MSKEEITTEANAILVGQNLGAGRPDRAEASVWRAGLYNTLFLLAEPKVVRYGVSCLVWVSVGYSFYAWGMVLVQGFNGAGDTSTPTLINLFCYWLFQLPLAFTLALGLSLGPTGVFVAITVAESLIAVVGVLVFRRGLWKTRVV